MIKEKVQEAIKEMTSSVGRNSKHVYTDNETGEWLQGVSTVSSIVPKEWLAAWGAKEAVKALGYSDYEGDTEHAEKMLEKIKKIDDVKKYQNLLKEAKGASARKSKDALVDGKAGHDWIETYIKAKISNNPLPVIPTGTLERPIKQFLDWEKREVEYWIAAEGFVYNPDKKYAGQLDAIYMSTDKKLTLCDFKFANHISPEYYLQTAGYAAAFERYDISFDKRMIIRLPKTLEKDEWDPKTFKYYKIANSIEEHQVPTQYEIDKKAFFEALTIKQWINYVTKI